MYLFISILIVIAAIVLTMLVLAQNSKGGGLASGFSSSNQIMGVRKTTDFVEKATWGFAGVIVVLSIVASLMTKAPVTVQESEIKTEVDHAFKVDPNLVNPNMDKAATPAKK
jgi:preprotein translocase subunit SecG